MSAQPWHKRYHSDALSGFMVLTLEERGAYQTLLDMMYDRGGPISDNERLLAGYMGVSIRKWKILRQSLIEKGKIEVDDDGCLFNFRVIFEQKKSLKTSRKHAENGMKGGRKRVENAKLSNEINESDQARLKPTSSLIPEARSQKEEDIKSSSSGEDDDFEFLVRRVCEIAGVSDASRKAALNNRALVTEWLAMGYTQAEIFASVRNTLSSTTDPIRSLKYFDPAMRSNAAKRAARPPPKPVVRVPIDRPDDDHDAVRAFRLALEKRAGQWAQDNHLGSNISLEICDGRFIIVHSTTAKSVIKMTYENLMNHIAAGLGLIVDFKDWRVQERKTG